MAANGALFLFGTAPSAQILQGLFLNTAAAVSLLLLFLRSSEVTVLL